MSKSSLKLARKWIKQADAVLVTASNGFAISEGVNLFTDNQNFRQALGNMVTKYRLPNLLSAFSYDYPHDVERFRMYGRVAEFYNYSYHASPVMKKLQGLLAGKDYLVWTSNTEGHFKQAGLPVLEIEGSWLEGICQNGDHVDLKNVLHEIYQKDQAGTLTAADVPLCDICRGTVKLNLAGPDFQINQTQVDAFQNFITRNQNRKLLVLELGIGAHNQLIKAPSMQLVAGNHNSRYITINKGELNIPANLAARAIGFDADLSLALEELLTGNDLGAKIIPPQEVKGTPHEDAKLIKQIYPSYTVNQGIRPGEMVMYVTLDKKHVSHFHMVQHDRSVMYSLGDATLVHCIRPDGHYYQVRLGLDKSKDEVHGFYIEAGTFVAFESLGDSNAGFAQISFNFMAIGDNSLMMPNKNQLLQALPAPKNVIERLAIEG